MSHSQPSGSDPRIKHALTTTGRMQDAISELQAMIGQCYPSARFTLSHPEDESESVELTAIVDIDDPDEVLDTVIERVIQLQIEDRLPIHVVPIRTPERVVAALRESRRRGLHALVRCPSWSEDQHKSPCASVR